MYGLVDCNNFYASCERVFNPKLNKKPIVVLSNNDGCVIARSNEAKKLGIKMGEPAFKITSLIKKYNIEIFSTNFALYGDMSQRVMNIIADTIPQIEIYSIDEAFLDLHQFKNEELLKVGRYIREKILKYTGLPVSIGIGKTKTLSKVANHVSKKEPSYKGVFMVEDSNQDNILEKIPIEKIWGVGSKSKKFLYYHGIKTAKQLKESKLKWIRTHLSITGERMVKELQGISCHGIDLSSNSKKSICTSRTFGKMVTSYNDLSSSIAMYTVRCAEKLRMQHSSAMLAHIFISTNPFRKNGKQYINYKTIKFPIATHDTGEMLSYILKKLKAMYKEGYKYKKAGVIVSGIIPNSQVQCNIFDSVNRLKSSKLIGVVDKINKKLGRDSIRYASQGYYRKWKLKQERLSPCYTTRWEDLLTINID